MNKPDDTLIRNCIKNNIKNLNSVFVFPTQICASMWVDKALEFSGNQCIALERFVAWDDFKGSSIRSQHQDKNSIPATMRDIFAENIVLANSKAPFLKNIIVEEFSKSASGFASWISNVLPSLSMWKNNFEKSGADADDEDKDFLELYNRYKKFLDDNNLFDPAWETPPFNSDGKKYFIFFPEILMDYAEYKTILESSSDIELISIPEEMKETVSPYGHLYSNTRNELKDVCHYLWKMHEEKNIPWNKIAISVPDLDTYGPYLARDLDIYEIPHVQKNGKPLSSSGIGSLFSQLLGCYSEKFSYDSLKTLLLNKELPWVEPEVNNMMIQFGRENNCICSYEYNDNQIDVWEESFKYPVDSKSVERLIPFYRQLKSAVTKIIESKTFEEIRTNYFSFREKFFDFTNDNFPEENEKILSRCVSELGTLIDLESDFKQTGIFEIGSPYSFFCSYLDGKMYVPQNASNGVQVLPYRTAGCAPFDVHVIVDASQSGISVVYKQLSFLRDDKRRRLGFTDDSNITQNFILLYAMNSQQEVLFTCSEKTIEGYSFTNSYLTQLDHRPGKNKNTDDFAVNDSYVCERDSYLNNSKENFPLKLYRAEKAGFEKWLLMSEKDGTMSENSLELISEKVRKRFVSDGKVKVSVTDMKSFYGCPRSFLFKKVYKLEQSDSAATLVNQYAIGNVNHLILELFFKELRTKNMALEYDEAAASIPELHKKILVESVYNGILQSEYSHLSKQLFLTTRTAIETSIIDSVTVLSQSFNGYKVFQVEETYELHNEEKKYFFKSKVDCLLSSPDGELALIDFKTTENSVPKNLYWDGEESVPDFQLPVYKYVLENQDKPLKIDACCFYSIRECGLKIAYSKIESIQPTRKSDFNEKFEMTTGRCLSLAEDYAEYVLNMDFSPSIINLDPSDCTSCEFKSVCRRTFAVSPCRD